MTDDPAFRVPRAPRPWAAVTLGASTGFLAAAVGILVWTLYRRVSAPDLPPPQETATVALFRLPSGGAREAILVPAGPDATGEPRLVSRLFPGATPPRELVTLLLANVSPSDAWDVDLSAEPLRCRAGSGPWEPIAAVPHGPGAGLDAADDLRMRSLGGGGAAHFSLEPGSLRQVLLTLPPGRKMGDLTDVEWGGRPLTRDRLEMERLRRFREDPAGTTTGR